MMWPRILKLLLCAIVMVPVALPGCASTTAEPYTSCGAAIMSMPIDAQSKVLAQLMAGNWEENKYYTRADFDNLSIVTFAGGILRADDGYVESIYDPAGYKVKRTFFDFAGQPSRTEIVSLPKDQFWALVIYVRKYFAKHATVPPTPVALARVEASTLDCKGEK